MDTAGPISLILSQKNSALWSIEPDAMVFDAIKLMADKNVGALPVIAGGKLQGIVSERDYTRNVILKGRSSKETPVREIMSRHLITATSSDSVSACMLRMTENRVRHLPVMDGKELVGILSVGDLVKFIISAQAATIEQLERFVTGQTPI
ncbi:MAG: CBS domain-containing protein [Chthoniobacteraceae bacterium]